MKNQNNVANLIKDLNEISVKMENNKTKNTLDSEETSPECYGTIYTKDPDETNPECINCFWRVGCIIEDEKGWLKR